MAAKTPAPVQTELQDQALKTLKWYGKGDFTNPHEGGIFTNLMDPAMLHRNSELASNEMGQGIEGLGTPDPNYLATVKENRAAHQDEVNAGQYENDLRQGIGAATGVAEDMSNLDEQTRNAILSSQTSSYNTQLSKPEKPAWWQYLLSAGAQAAGPIAEAI